MFRLKIEFIYIIGNFPLILCKTDSMPPKIIVTTMAAEVGLA
jgi:hypothetical protein